MLFENHNVHARSGEKITGHDASRASTDDAAPRIQAFNRLGRLFHILDSGFAGHAEMTLSWKRRAATIKRNVPIAKSAKPSVQR